MAGQQHSISLIDFTSLSNETSFLSQLNTNFQTLEDLLNNTYVKFQNPTSGSASAVVDDLDMDSNRIINLPQATENTEPVRYDQFLAGPANTNTILNGSGTPASGLGNNGDFYIDTDNNLIFGPKTSGAWGSGTSIRGGILSGSGVPASGLGEDGDFYIDTSADEVYGPKSGGSWGSGTSMVGSNGSDGKTILNGVVDPTTEGVDGDFYINTATMEIFGPKASGSWPASGVSITASLQNINYIEARKLLTSAQTLTTGTTATILWDSSGTNNSSWTNSDGTTQLMDLGAPKTISSVDTGTDTITFSSSHGYSTGDGPVMFENSGGALPTGISANTDYWVIKVDADEIQIATSYANAIAGTQVDITGAGSGTNTTRDDEYLVIPNSMTSCQIIVSGNFENIANTANAEFHIELSSSGDSFSATGFENSQQFIVNINDQNSTADEPNLYLVTPPITVSGGEKIRVRATQASGGNLDFGNTPARTFFSIVGYSGQSVGELPGIILRTSSNTIGGSAGAIQFKAVNDAAETLAFSRIEGFISDETDSSEDGYTRISSLLAGSLTEVVRLGVFDPTDTSLFGLQLSSSSQLYKNISSTNYKSILEYDFETQTASSSSSITFTSVPSSNVDRVVWRGRKIVSSDDDKELRFQFTSSGTPVTSAVYHNAVQTANTDDNTNSHGTKGETFGFIGQKASNYSLGSSSDEFMWVNLEIEDPNSSSDHKVYTYKGSYIAASGRLVSFSGGGIFASNSAVDGVKFFFEGSGNISSGTFNQRIYI